MDKKALVAIALSLGIWVGWQKIYLEPFQKKAAEQQAALEAARDASIAKKEIVASDNSKIGKPVADDSAKNVVVNSNAKISTLDTETDHYKLSLSNGPNFINSWSLKNYAKPDQSKELINLSYITGVDQQLRLRFPDGVYKNLNDSVWSDIAEKNGNFSSVLRSSKVSVERVLSTNTANYDLSVVYKFKFSGDVPKFIYFDLEGSPARPHDKEGSILGQTPDKVHVTYRDGESRVSVMAASLKETKESSMGTKWLGLDTRYFGFAIVPDKGLRADTGVQVKQGFNAGSPAVFGSLVYATGDKKEFSVPMKVFFGPKQLEKLELVDPVLGDAIDFGWTSPIAIPLLKGLKFLYKFIGNYGFAIILLTLFIKILLYPLTYKSMKSMAKMARLQPQLNALREKYKDDKEKLNQEMMQFMKTNGYNPVGGCLPMLLQMPIFFALYRVLFNSMELYQAPFGLWIHDLSASDHFFVTPVLLTGLMYLQQKLSPNTSTDPAQQKMLQFMPVMFGVFMLMLPAGLNIYMVVNSVVSIAQQYYLNKKFGVGSYAKKA